MTDSYPSGIGDWVEIIIVLLMEIFQKIGIAGFVYLTVFSVVSAILLGRLRLIAANVESIRLHLAEQLRRDSERHPYQ